MDSDEYLQIAGIQHFCFCRRQWALAYIEQQWSENFYTAQGHVDHERAHDEAVKEKRGNRLVVRGMRVISHRLRMTGICDVVEFQSCAEGIFLQGQEGRWRPMPIEYKHGSPKETDADRVQLCAQAMALEEMLVTEITLGALYYATPRRREMVELTPQLREKTQNLAKEMVSYWRRGYTPKVRPTKACNACSLKEICVPKLYRYGNAQSYITSHITESADAEG